MTIDLNRRSLMQAVCLALLLSKVRAAPTDGSEAVASTTYGKVRGRRIAGVYEFKGIPYGSSTAGKNRFRPPNVPAPWSGIRPAIDEAPQCFQTDPFAKPTGTLPQPRESEDCLHLNVWTTGLRDDKKRPVMVWLHGGGLWVGSTAGEWQSGHRLSNRGGIVMVAPNHRLNVLGYACLEEFDSLFRGSGNAGLLDLVLALEWVRDNIEEFGGDPGNVTIFGQSGGGQKVSFLMALPAARGLFHKAIIQSGPAPVTIERDYATAYARRLLARLAISARSVRKLQEVPALALMRAYYEQFHAEGGYGVLGIIQGVAPVVGDRLLPRQPFWNGASPDSKDVPLLIGSTRTEMTEYTLASNPAAAQMDWVGVQQELVKLFNRDTGSILSRYRSDHPNALPWEVYSLIVSDWPTRIFSVKIAEEQAKLRGAPVYMYRMDWTTPVRDGILMSPHAVDIAFALDTVQANSTSNGGGPAPQQMADQMCAAWLAFARSGNPQTGTLPHWPAYEGQRRATMLFDLPSHVVRDPDGDDRRIIQENMTRYRYVARETGH